MKTKLEMKNSLDRSFDAITPDNMFDKIIENSSSVLTREEEEEIFGVVSSDSVDENIKSRITMSGIAFRFAPIAACFMLAILLFFNFTMSAKHTTVEIRVNPYIVVEVEDEKVVDIKAKNTDAESIISNVKINQPIDKVVDDIITNIYKEGYFEKNHVVFVSVDGDNAEYIEKNVEKQVCMSVGKVGADATVTVMNAEEMTNKTDEEISKIEDEKIGVPNAVTVDTGKTTENNNAEISDVNRETTQQENKEGEDANESDDTNKNSDLDNEVENYFGNEPGNINSQGNNGNNNSQTNNGNDKKVENNSDENKTVNKDNSDKSKKNSKTKKNKTKKNKTKKNKTKKNSSDKTKKKDSESNNKSEDSGNKSTDKSISNSSGQLKNNNDSSDKGTGNNSGKN